MNDKTMIDFDRLARCLRDIGLDTWPASIIPPIESRLTLSAHGDFERWRALVGSLDGVRSDPKQLKQALLGLSPWRKGPFDIGGVNIDAEWRSDLKWARLADRIEPLDKRRVLDVGCGNGYYALRMREAGAASVIGIDPTLLYIMQFLAVNHFIEDASTFVLPLRLHELPLPARQFDSCFSMGVLYHQRAPIDHIRDLRDTLRPGGQLVLETLYLPGDERFASTPPDRYARMKNVWLLPTIPELTTWLDRSGLRGVEVVDTSVTTIDEQRSTEWMSFESLSDALDPDDDSLTVEGLPRPRRVLVIATAP